MPSFRMHCEELAVAPLGEEESEEEDCSFLGSITDGEDASNNAGCSHARYGMHLPDLGSGRLPREWAFDDEAKGFESLLEAFLWAASDVVSAKWRQHALGAEQTEGRCVPTSLVGALLPQHLDPSVQHLRGWLDAALFQRFLTKLFLVCVGTYVVKLSRGTWLQGPGDPQMQLHKLSEEAICLSDYFAGLSLKTNGRITGAASSCLWEPGRVLNVLHAVLASPGGRYDKWKPRSPILRPSQLQSLDWKGPLSFEDSLSKLVSVLSEGALPIRDVLAWLSDGVPCQNFQELPTPLPAGGAYLMPRDKETQGSRRTSSASINLAQVSLLPRRRLSSGSNVVSAQDRAESQTSSTPSRDPSQRRMSGGRFSFFGQAPRQQTQVAQAHLQATRSPADSLVVSMAEEAASLAAEATSLAVRNSGALGLAAEGALCELRVEQVGAYGAFCTVSVSWEGSQQLDPARQRNAAPSGDASFSQPRRGKLRPLRRWAQLVKVEPQEAPAFQIFRARPQELQVVPRTAREDNSTLVSVPLTNLREVTLTGAASLELVFAPQPHEGLPENSLRYSLSFDCPSHLFRWRLVLESWWAPQPIKELRPVVLYVPLGMNCSSLEFEDDSWRNIAGPLTRQALEQRLGGLWKDARKRLEAA